MRIYSNMDYIFVEEKTGKIIDQMEFTSTETATEATGYAKALSKQGNGKVLAYVKVK